MPPSGGDIPQGTENKEQLFGDVQLGGVVSCRGTIGG